MDNFSMDVTADSEQTLRELLSIAFRHNCPGGKASHWTEIGRMNDQVLCRVLVFLWHEEKREGEEVHKLPVPLDADGAAEIAIRWLDETDRGNEPDHDGSNSEGFRVYCDFWGHVETFHYAVVGIVPIWAMHGK